MIDSNVFLKLSYGLYVLSCKSEKDNACIINTVIQVTDNPKRIAVAVNKDSFTCKTIENTGVFTVSVLTQTVPFSLIERFGFKSGTETDKFKGFNSYEHSKNGTAYITEGTNAFISCSVTEKTDCGTHIVFIAGVDEANLLSNEPSLTYEYYLSNIKPKPEVKVKGFVCKICGYVYEGETLPNDFICPWCKHGAEDFEPIK